jgi:hypothetical protein
MLKNLTKRTINVVLLSCSITTLLFLSIFEYKKYQNDLKREINLNQKIEEERALTCPSLLSVADDARDTLIIMKNKTICIQYVLENLR